MNNTEGRDNVPLPHREFICRRVAVWPANNFSARMPQLHTVKLEYHSRRRTKGPLPHWGVNSRTKEQTWLSSLGRHRRKQCAAMRFSSGVRSRGVIRAVIFERISTGRVKRGQGRGGQLGSCLAVPARGKEEEGLSLALTFRSRHTTGSPDGLNAGPVSLCLI